MIGWGKDNAWHFWSLKYEREATGCFLKFYVTRKGVHSPVVMELWENHEIQVKNQKRGLVVEQLNQPVSKLHCLWYSDNTENISCSYLFNLSAFLKQKTYIIIKNVTAMALWCSSRANTTCVRFKKTVSGWKTALYLQ